MRSRTLIFEMMEAMGERISIKTAASAPFRLQPLHPLLLLY
jgi:hypothetical protein